MLRALAPARMLHDISAALRTPTHQAVPHDDPEEPELISCHMQTSATLPGDALAPSKHCHKEKPASCRAVHRALDILLRFQLDDDIAAPQTLILWTCLSHLMPSQPSTSPVNLTADAALLSHMSNLTPPVPCTANGSSGMRPKPAQVQAARPQRLAGCRLA
jgi:hypothetical protein